MDLEDLSTTEETSTTSTSSDDARAPIIAVDLDETVIQSDTEELIPGAKDALIALKKLGWKIIIWTARGDAAKYVPEIMKRYGIPFDAVNENLPGIKDKSRKIVFDAVVDNKNVDFEKGWEEVVRELELRRKGWRHKGITKMFDPATSVIKDVVIDKELEEELVDAGSCTFVWEE